MHGFSVMKRRDFTTSGNRTGTHTEADATDKLALSALRKPNCKKMSDEAGRTNSAKHMFVKLLESSCIPRCMLFT